jgi:hypothetical protein
MRRRTLPYVPENLPSRTDSPRSRSYSVEMKRTVRLAVMLCGVVSFGLVAAPPASSAMNYPPVPHSIAEDLPTCLNPMTSATLPDTKVTADLVAIKAMAGTDLQGIGPCPSGRVILALTPGNEPLAQRIRALFGPAVLITVGFTEWNGRPGRSPVCGPLPRSSSLPKGLTLSLHLNSNTVRSGDPLGGTLVLGDSGVSSFEMDTGQPVQAVVVRPGTHQVVGVYSGGIAGTGYAVRLDPGQSYQVAVIGGTARCDGGIGSAVPPGTYQILTVAMDETGKPPRYLAPPVNLTVTRR